ncbi:hypothetical protein E2C01_043320 [Portunus trituberculatus]|uniref:Uncharacterized protein n=1 Tax=Portunus trituberculatus TaxID=210409 RepID=A0A5B7FVU1_PORTR|nr:hypothetical protein [Portunus trituberculatus]
MESDPRSLVLYKRESDTLTLKKNYLHSGKTSLKARALSGGMTLFAVTGDRPPVFSGHNAHSLLTTHNTLLHFENIRKPQFRILDIVLASEAHSNPSERRAAGGGAGGHRVYSEAVSVSRGDEVARQGPAWPMEGLTLY